MDWDIERQSLDQQILATETRLEQQATIIAGMTHQAAALRCLLTKKDAVLDAATMKKTNKINNLQQKVPAT